MSRATKSNKNSEKVPEGRHFLTLPQAESKFNITSRNIGSATFSSMAKQAESLVNGDNSLVFNNYDNKLYFHANKYQMKDCVNIDMLKKQINNVDSVNFGIHGNITGISDGYYVNKSGAITKVSDKTIALSTVFGANLVVQQDTIAKDLRMEIERRKNDDNILTQKLKETSDACEMAVRMVNYINYDTENHSFSINIPFEDSTSENLTFLDLMPSETIESGEINTDPGSGISQLNPVNSSSVNVLNVDRYGVELNGHLIFNNHSIDEIAINLYNSSDNTLPTTRAITNYLEPMNISITRNTENIAGNSTRIERNTNEITNIQEQILEIEEEITRNTENIAGNSTRISKNESNIANIQDKIEEIEEEIKINVVDELINDDNTLKDERLTKSIVNSATVEITEPGSPEKIIKLGTDVKLTYVLEGNIIKLYLNPMMHFKDICNGENRLCYCYFHRTHGNTVMYGDYVRYKKNDEGIVWYDDEKKIIDFIDCEDHWECVLDPYYEWQITSFQVLYCNFLKPAVPDTMKDNNLRNIIINTIDPIVRNNIINTIYPIGSLYLSFNNINPGLLFGGQWEQIVDRFLYCSNSSGEIGGSKKITVENLPEHKHGIKNYYDDFNYNHGNTTFIKTTDTMSIPHDCGDDLAQAWTRTTYTENNGSGTDYMPEYITIYAWKRVA